MQSTTTRLWASTIAAGAILLLADPAMAQLEAIEEDLPPLFRERLAFDVADTDNDGLISEAEYARDIIAGFTALDDEGKGHLTPEDLGEHDPALFDRVDADGDGVLSFEEVMSFKMEAFAAADQDGDGYITFDEMLESAQSHVEEVQP